MQYRSSGVISISTVAGSNSVVGNGTAFVSNGVVAGALLFVNNNPAPFTIYSATETGLVLTSNFPETLSDVPFVISISFTPNKGIPYITRSDLNAADIIAAAIKKIDAEFQFGLIWYGAVLNIVNDVPVDLGYNTVWGIGASPTGGWSDHAGQIGIVGPGATIVEVPDRTYIYNEDDNSLYIKIGGVWKLLNFTVGPTNLDELYKRIDGANAVTGFKDYIHKATETYWKYELVDGIPTAVIYVNGERGPEFQQET